MDLERSVAYRLPDKASIVQVIAAALTFLSLNRQDVEIPTERWEETEALMLTVADGKLKREEATARFKDFREGFGAKGA